MERRLGPPGELTIGTAAEAHEELRERTERREVERQGIETTMIVGKGVGHAWLDSAPEAITAWFLTHGGA